MTAPGLERDSLGRFVESDESLYPKTIGLRVSKSRWDKLQAIAKAKGKTIAEIAREVLHQYIDTTELDSQQPEK